MPSKSVGLIIHKRYFINEELSKTTISNICVECAMLSSQGAIPMQHFRESLFQTSAVILWITRSTNNVVVNLLEKNNVDSMLSQQQNELTQGVAEVGSQLSQLLQNAQPIFPRMATLGRQGASLQISNPSFLDNMLFSLSQTSFHENDLMYNKHNHYI